MSGTLKSSDTQNIQPIDELAYRLEQQRLLARFGIEALRAGDLDETLSSAVRLSAAGMRTSLAKILEFLPDERALLVVAGVGWKDGIVGTLRLRADKGSPAGYAFQTEKPIISNHLGCEGQFRTPQFMVEHGIKRAINVIVEVKGEKWGVLEVDSTQAGAFSVADLAFMQGFADLVGVAIERHRAEAELRAARDYQEILTREASHRVKNSLAMVSAVLRMKRRTITDSDTVEILNDAEERIATIAMAHDLLWQGTDVGLIDLAQLLQSLTQNLSETAFPQQISSNFEHVTVSADTGLPLGLIVNELVTNAIKYAYGEEGGLITVAGHKLDDCYIISVMDTGRGFPAGFDPETSKSQGLGLRLINSLTRQLRARIEFSHARPGATVTLQIPLTNRRGAESTSGPADEQEAPTLERN